MQPGQRGQSDLHREARAPLLILLAVTGTVLLIACANIANLLLARGAGRAAEMAVRLSIGANRGQLMTQLLVESCLLAVMGAVVRHARGEVDARRDRLARAARGGGHGGLHARPRRCWLFAGALALGTGLRLRAVPGPAQHAPRPGARRSRTRRASPAARAAAKRFRTTLATVQIAMSMALLVPAGLFAKSLVNVSRVDLGLNTEHLVTFAVAPELNGYDKAAHAAAVRADRRRAGGAARRLERGHVDGARPRRRQLEQQHVGGGLRAGTRYQQRLGLQQRGPGLLQDDGHSADGGSRVHARRRRRARRRWPSSTRPSRASSTSAQRRRQAHRRGRRRRREARHRDRRRGAGREVQRREAGRAGRSTSRPTGRTSNWALATSTCARPCRPTSC